MLKVVLVLGCLLSLTLAHPVGRNRHSWSRYYEGSHIRPRLSLQRQLWLKFFFDFFCRTTTTTTAPITSTTAPITSTTAPITSTTAPITTPAPITSTTAPITTTTAPTTTTVATTTLRGDGK
ncbi:nucleoporin NSP1-like [Larimichthys crocea]|uniref:nucleoporin NSP1-like n=1 Tax=Larimichthys crocea TaxID=215358 RepID=UPI000F5F6AB0|nr:nucleoporin NSP1-like [Larimichthys crocea]XP_027139584.1 nucleoporin NSP1-like [Larimichthys crocea]